MVVKGRPVTLYQEIHSNKTREKPVTHQRFLRNLKMMLPNDCQPIVVTDAGFKSPWFRPVQSLNWHLVGRVRKPHFYSVNKGETWQCITQLYKRATSQPKSFADALIARREPFPCTLIVFKGRTKGRHATNPDGSPKRSKHSLKHAEGATDPWLLATSLPAHRHLAKQVVAIYRQRMQIEEGFRDMKSRRFGLGLEHSRSIKPARLAVLVLLSTLASIVAILLGWVVHISGHHRRFQANTKRLPVLSFHTLGLRAWATRMRFTASQWKRAIKQFTHNAEEAWHGTASN
ncbi:hypothetical protein GCM10009092_35060 [Bowmanella denitrificans]|uniref:Transposase IS4-like domain-containing protein n=2 Tax=Bowmanella denitrificans TaxID=366582 RepID=A0ABP3HEI8_9ALTE